MFCPKCGKADQSPDTNCRQCFTYLSDSEPVQPDKLNSVLSALSAVTCFGLAVALYLYFLNLGAPPTIIYVTAGLLVAMGIFHIQALVRALQNRVHVSSNQDFLPTFPETIDRPTVANGILNKAEFESMVPVTITDVTTKNLVEPIRRGSS